MNGGYITNKIKYDEIEKSNLSSEVLVLSNYLSYE